MGEAVERVALVTHQMPGVAEEVLRQVLPVLAQRGVQVLLPPGEKAKHPTVFPPGAEECCEVSREEIASADLCLVLGGDGTMLRTLRLTRDLGVPVAGINLGRVGFLAAVARDRVAEDLPRLLAGGYVAHPLVGLTARVNGTPLRAVNDIVVGRGRDAGICRISYAVNDVPLFDVRCDALIAATPAGSTAYNLAVGGPVLGIGLQGFVLSYVAPHTLETRSVVAAGPDVVRIRNESSHEAVDIVVDGEHMGSLEPLAALEIRTLPELATLALLPENDFYRHFRERFVQAPERC